MQHINFLTMQATLMQLHFSWCEALMILLTFYPATYSVLSCAWSANYPVLHSHMTRQYIDDGIERFPCISHFCTCVHCVQFRTGHGNKKSYKTWKHAQQHHLSHMHFLHTAIAVRCIFSLLAMTLPHVLDDPE